MRVDLSEFQEGAYAELRDKASWGLVCRMQDNTDAETGTIRDAQQFVFDLLRSLVRKWNVQDEDGVPLPDPKQLTRASIESIDAGVVSKLTEQSKSVLQSTYPDPNSSSAS